MSVKKKIAIILLLAVIGIAIVYTLQTGLLLVCAILSLLFVSLLFYSILLQNQGQSALIIRKVESASQALEATNRAHVDVYEQLLSTRQNDTRQEMQDLRLRLRDALSENHELEELKSHLSFQLEELRRVKNEALFDLQRKLLRISDNLRHEERARMREEFRTDPNRALKKYLPQSARNVIKSDTSSAPLPPHGDVHAYYGEKYLRDIRFGEKFILRSASVLAREQVARAVTDSQYDLSDLIRVIRLAAAGLDKGQVESTLRKWKVPPLLSLARIFASQNALPSDLQDAQNIFELVLHYFGREAFSAGDEYIYLELLTDAEMYEAAEEFLTGLKGEAGRVHRTLVRGNLLVKASDNFEEIESQWLQQLNEMYQQGGLAPLFLVPGREHPIDRLRPDDVHEVETGPLVSVLMPTHNGSAHIHTAVTSILSQTWRNLELLVIDDGSELSHWHYISTKLPEDPRLKLIRLEENKGAYHARNVGLERAKGDYITVHDDDDWSHPQKLEIQIRALMDDSEAVGNMSYMTRIDEDVQFIRINDNPEYNQRNYSSLLVSKTTLQRIGPWDEVTRAADAEMHERLTSSSGKKIEGVLTPPLSFARARTGSLTHGEMKKGYIDPRRYSYGLAFMGWHQQLKTNEESLSWDTIKGKPFTRPLALTQSATARTQENYDVIYVTDFRFPGGNSTLVASEIRSACELGLRVGIVQLDSPSLRASRPFNTKITDLFSEYEIDFLTVVDNVRCSVLVLRHPTILQYADRLVSSIENERLIIVVNNPPVGPDGVESAFDLEACAQHAKRAFNNECLIYPESAQIRNLCVPLWPHLNYAAENWPGFVDPEKYLPVRPRSPQPDRLPVIGRHSRDHRLKWPDTTEAILAAYVSSSFETQILGGANSIKKLLSPEHRAQLNVVEFGGLDPTDFLASLDFWVYFHSESLTESFGMSIIEAMASGLPVILPTYMEDMFGDGAIYGTPQDVPELVGKYWNDEALYVEQCRRAIKMVEDFYSVSAYQSRLLELTTLQTRSA